MFTPRSGGLSSAAPEVPRRRHRKGLSSSGQDLNQIGKKYDRDAFAFNHYIGYLKQPLKRHLSSDITYLVPSMPVPVVQISEPSDETPSNYRNNYPINDNNASKSKSPQKSLGSSNDRPPLAQRLDSSNANPGNQEPIYSVPRRSRSFRKQRSLDNPTNDNQLISTSGPKEANNQTCSISVASSSVPHLPILAQPNVYHEQAVTSYQSRPMSVSTEGLIQHIMSQQSQIERLSKQQDFLTQQLIISRELTSDARRRGRSRARSRSISSKTTHDDNSLTSLEPVKQRSSSREKIQEQLHAQQARVQQHIQQLEAQLELIRDIRTGSRPSSRSHSQAASVRDGSSCPPEDKTNSKRPSSADPKWFETSSSQPNELIEKLANDRDPARSKPETKSEPDNRPVGFTTKQLFHKSMSKPRLILTNASEESKDGDDNLSRGENNTRFVCNRPTLLDQDDGIPFMDEDELNEEPDDTADESDELETVFEFDKSKLPKQNSGDKRIDHGDEDEDEEGEEEEEEEDYEDDEDWEDEIDFNSRDAGGSPEAESDPWAQLMEEDIIRAREEMDRQRSLMERQEMELADQRQQLLAFYDMNEINTPDVRQAPSLPTTSIEGQDRFQMKDIYNNEMSSTDSPAFNKQQSGLISQYNKTDESSLRPNVNLIPLPQSLSPSRSTSPMPFSMRQETQQANPMTFSKYASQFDSNKGQENIFNFDEASIQSYHPSIHTNQSNVVQTGQQQHQIQRATPNYAQQQVATTSTSGHPINRHKSPVPENFDQSNYDHVNLGNIGPLKIIDRQISTPASVKPIQSPSSNYIKRPSLENQTTNSMIQPSILRSKMMKSPVNLASSKYGQGRTSPYGTNQSTTVNQPSVPPRRRSDETSRSRSPILGSSSVAPSYRIQTNKNRMAGQTISSGPKRPQRSIQSTVEDQFTNLSFNQPANALPVSSDGRLTPRVYSPKPMQLTSNRSQSMFKPISSNQPKTTPIITVDSTSRSNLNLSPGSPSFNNLTSTRKSPSPVPTNIRSSGSSLIQRSSIMGNTNINQNSQQQQNQQISSPLLAPMTISQSSGNTLKVDMQTIRSNRSRAASPAPPNREKSPASKPTRKIFINKDTVEAGSFVDHFNHYYAPNTEAPRRPLSQQFSHISTGELNKIGRSVTPMRDFNVSNKMDKEELRKADSSSNKLNNQSTVDALIDAPIHFERRQTLPEITKGLGIESSTSKEEAILRNLAGKKKHSLPKDDLHEIPPIPGWEREKVATLAHEAREARMNQPSGAAVHLVAATNWFIKYKFIGLIIFFNALLFYLFMRILQPIDQDEKKSQ